MLKLFRYSSYSRISKYPHSVIFNRYMSEIPNNSNIPSINEKSPPHLVLIDGSQLLYRAFFSTPLLKRADGTFTGVVFGYTKMLLKFLREFKADYFAVVFDPAGKTFRNSLYPEYKAKRNIRPREIEDQFELIKEVSKTVSVPLLRMEGFEADDLIASYANSAQRRGIVTTIVSNDKDMLQCVNKSVAIYDPIKKRSWGEDDIIEHYGVTPMQMPHFQTLTGDNVDNVPGVPGIGPKGAKELINEFGDINNLIDNVDKISNRLKRERIKSYSASLPTMLKVIELRKDLILPVPIERLKRKPLNEKALLLFLERNEFYSVLRQLSSVLPSNESVVPKPMGEENYYDDGDNTNMASKLEPSSAKVVRIDKDVYLRVKGPSFSGPQPGYTLVRDPIMAHSVVDQLMSLPDDVYHACDTETWGFDIKRKSPYTSADMQIICASIYCGPDFDFGNGPRIWIDNMDEAEGVLDVFRPYFESERIKKVWHNYSFDRAVLWKVSGFDVKGFGGDTMHMARLWDSARIRAGGYSLENLSASLVGERKVPIKERFGLFKIKRDGEPSVVASFPDLKHLQRDKEWMYDWIDYSTLDAEMTWKLREELEKRLLANKWLAHGVDDGKNLFDFYKEHWLHFGEVLTDIEREGIHVDRNYLKEIEKVAILDRERNEKTFKDWAVSICPDAKYMNVSSDAQKQHFLFSPCRNTRTREERGGIREFETLNNADPPFIEEGKKKPKKMRPFHLKGLGLPFKERTASGWPAVSGEVLRTLSGVPNETMTDLSRFGSAANMFPTRKEGEDACRALMALQEVTTVNTLVNTFIGPLQTLGDDNGRVHASINLNTETGRLSCRNPNLQNQPALEKDRYKIRHAFSSKPGYSLIVADYGQLELRVLAHMSRCKSMINAFKEGGDFHSRTAIGMYPHIASAVSNNRVLLEWDYSNGEPHIPLLKDVYASERRKAKTLNFSIAYGKTPHGLSKDWGVSVAEAHETLESWYKDRPEVKSWQKRVIEESRINGYTTTLMGRTRPLPDLRDPRMGPRKHAERAAINTPIQGGAADVVVGAMLGISKSEILRKLGYKMVLQVHDEVILEGPTEHVVEAEKEVVSQMEKPLDIDLEVDLVVDSKHANTWYEAK